MDGISLDPSGAAHVVARRAEVLDQRPGDALGAVCQTPGCSWHQRRLAVERPRRLHLTAKAHERRKLFTGTLRTCKHA